MAKVRDIILLPLNDETLSVRLKDHPLRGDWADYRDLHIEPDWLLFYTISASELKLARTGTQYGVFRE